MPHTLLISCRDRTGIVAAMSSFLASAGANILDADQHAEPAEGRADEQSEPQFFMRLEFDASAMAHDDAQLREAIGEISREFDMQWTLHSDAARPRVAVFCSKTPHCLYDLLMREAMGELNGEIALVISNHADLRDAAEHFDKPFHHVPVSRGNKAEAEAEQQRLLSEAGVDLVVLARYMQVLSGDFCQAWSGRAINIHHSFLPAFVGARPYHQAKARGVKIIGATAHYVTAELDQGPIIAQDVTPVTHRDAVEDLVRKGRDLERQVLARAVRYHLDHRVLIHGRRTIVFR